MAIIRKATKKDWKDISDIFIKESSKKPYSQKWTKKTAFDKVKEFLKENETYVALVNKKIVGFASLNITVEGNGKGATVRELWLKSEFQGQGIGKMLIKFVEDKCKNNGIGSIFLISNKTSKAFGFYKKIGYKTYDKDILMGKKLK